MLTGPGNQARGPSGAAVRVRLAHTARGVAERYRITRMAHWLPCPGAGIRRGSDVLDTPPEQTAAAVATPIERWSNREMPPGTEP